jgi:hypothetical protein
MFYEPASELVSSLDQNSKEQNNCYIWSSRCELTVAVAFKERDVIDANEAAGAIVAPHPLQNDLQTSMWRRGI